MKKRSDQLMLDVSSLEIQPIEDDVLISIAGGCTPSVMCSLSDCSSGLEIAAASADA